MGTRLNIKNITPDTEEWTCKIQVVDKTHPKDNRKRTKKYQLIVLEDEEETQILAIIFGGDISHFGELFKPFHTYLVSVAQVKESTDSYEEPINKFTWYIDKSTIVEPIEKVTPIEAPLPPPKHLTVTPFAAFEHLQFKESEFDVLAIVVNGEPPKYAPNGKTIQEFIIMDNEKKPIKFTLWEEYVHHEGSEIFKQLEKYLVILARRITKSSFGLSNRYNTTIHIDPPHEEAKVLIKWAETMKSKLIEYTIKTTSTSGSLTFAPFEEEIMPISEIQGQPLGKVFYIQAEISVPNITQRFCSLSCSKCKLLYTRTAIQREIICASCKNLTQLVPRCLFEITVTDNSGSAIATISDEPAHKLLFLTLEEIFHIHCIKKQSLPFENVQKQLNGKKFRIQIKKLLSGKLSVLNCTEIENAPHSQLKSIMLDVGEGSKRKFDELIAKDSQDQDAMTKNSTSCNIETIGKRGPTRR